jgi:predicted ATP-binding protein involved in virulence
MKIEKLTFKRLYGFMDKSIAFQDNISILVGINGAGKTSILNIINWLLKPSLPDLCMVEFESIGLEFVYKKEKYTIHCMQNSVEVIIELRNLTQQKTYPTIQANFRHHPRELTKNEHLKSSLIDEDCYGGLSPEQHEVETWDFLFRKLPEPVVIGLDRSLYTKEADGIRYESAIGRKRRHQTLHSPLITQTPIDRVKDLIIQDHNRYRNNVLSQYQELSEKVMLSTFGEIQTSAQIATLLKTPPPTEDRLNILERQVLDFLRESKQAHNAKNVRNRPDLSTGLVRSHFSNLRKIATAGTKNNDLLYLANISQFIKINALVKEFDQFEKNLREQYEPIKTFLDITNRFLKDSSKELYYDKETASVKFKLIQENGRVIDEGRDILNLSSGEKQLVILLTYIRHLEGQSIFIIDEPELSLHPKWQMEFLEAVEKLMPTGAQLILATHSPEIIGDRKERCTILLPYNI